MRSENIVIDELKKKKEGKRERERERDKKEHRVQMIRAFLSRTSIKLALLTYFYQCFSFKSA